MKKILSLATVVFLLFSLIAGIQAEEGITAPGVVDLSPYAINLETARKEEDYARTSYYLTSQKEAPAAIIEYYELYHPTDNINVIKTYYNALVKLQQEMTKESNFAIVLEQARYEQQKAGAAMSKAVTQYYQETPEIKRYTYEYRTSHTENEDWHSQWGMTKANTIYAQLALTIATLNNTHTLAEYYTPEETANIAELETYIIKLESLGAKKAEAAQNFDEDKVSALSSEMQSVKAQADALAAEMFEKIFEAWREVNKPQL